MSDTPKSDRLHEAIEELSYALPSGSLDEVNRLVAELESAPASERAKRAVREQDLELSLEVWSRRATSAEARALAAEAVIQASVNAETFEEAYEALTCFDLSALREHDAKVKADAWWEGVNDQWKHRPVGNRVLEHANPYRAAENRKES